MTVEEREHNGPVSAATRGCLGEVRRALLRLHKVLLEEERASYERGRGSVGGGGEFLQLILNDPWFAWLQRPLVRVAAARLGAARGYRRVAGARAGGHGR
jgi:hypothetical protein